jgi:hypothetical protein
MEKVSHIVRGNARVTTADNKSAPTARPGMPAFGRPQAESAPVPERSLTSTAQRAAAMHEGMVEAKKAMTQERMVQKISDDFFMSRTRRPSEPAAQVELPASVAADVNKPAEQLNLGEVELEDQAAMSEPKGYTPRGSYINVMA